MCARQCQCAPGTVCDFVTGMCLRDCPPGWTGPICADGEYTASSVLSLSFQCPLREAVWSLLALLPGRVGSMRVNVDSFATGLDRSIS